MLNELQERLKEQYYSVDFDNSITDYVLDSAYNTEFGARPLKRFIQDQIETYIASRIVEGNLSTKKAYLMKFENQKLELIEK